MLRPQYFIYIPKWNVSFFQISGRLVYKSRHLALQCVIFSNPRPTSRLGCTMILRLCIMWCGRLVYVFRNWRLIKICLKNRKSSMLSVFKQSFISLSSFNFAARNTVAKKCFAKLQSSITSFLMIATSNHWLI